MVENSKLIHITRNFYRCEVTGWIYQFVGIKYENIYRFILIEGTPDRHIINKYKKMLYEVSTKSCKSTG